MGVELGVVLPRGRLLERSHHQPTGIGMLADAVAPHPGGRPVPLQVLEHRPHCNIVRLHHTGIAGEAPPHRHRLGRRERRIEPRHRRDQPALGVIAIHQRPAQPCPRHRVMARQQRLQVLGRHRTRQAQPVRLAAKPLALTIRAVVGQVAGVVARRGPAVLA
jgi:hypothetical protein